MFHEFENRWVLRSIPGSRSTRQHQEENEAHFSSYMSPVWQDLSTSHQPQEHIPVLQLGKRHPNLPLQWCLKANRKTALIFHLWNKHIGLAHWFHLHLRLKIIYPVITSQEVRENEVHGEFKTSNFNIAKKLTKSKITSCSNDVILKHKYYSVSGLPLDEARPLESVAFNLDNASSSKRSRPSSKILRYLYMLLWIISLMLSSSSRVNLFPYKNLACYKKHNSGVSNINLKMHNTMS